MPLSARVYKCENCGLSRDRDLNASKNLEKYGTTDSLSGSKACGELNQHPPLSPLIRGDERGVDSMKQEVNIHPMKSGDLLVMSKFE